MSILPTTGPEKNFRSHDLPTAAVLLHRQCRFLGLDRSDQRRVAFVFEDSEKLRQTLDQYWRDELLCPAQSLLADFKRAKHILFDCK